CAVLCAAVSLNAGRAVPSLLSTAVCGCEVLQPVKRSTSGPPAVRVGSASSLPAVDPIEHRSKRVFRSRNSRHQELEQVYPACAIC
ncbi:unnamed protein product, partial [Laminaria digitata]